MTTDREAHDAFKGLRLKGPRWSRADYEMVAAILAQRFAICGQYTENPRVAAHVVKMLADDFARTFELDNPAFKRDLFLKACGVLQ